MRKGHPQAASPVDRLDNALAFATKKKRNPKPPAPRIRTASHLEQLAELSIAFVQLELASSLLEQVLQSSRRSKRYTVSTRIARALSEVAAAVNEVREGA